MKQLLLLAALLISSACLVLADTPSGSIVIYGPNGTSVTGTRNVFLNISYSAAHAINGCRFVNDDQLNLPNMPWESCTTVKAWILSASYGNKIVYFQIRDSNGDNAILSDTISYVFMQDYTAPSPPAVYDGESGDDIDWHNSNTTIFARWFNSTDDISTVYYRYRILNNSICSGSCAFADVGTNTSAAFSSLNLTEGRNFSFEVMAYTNSLLNSTAVSDGVVIDTTRPGAPGINSSTHPVQSQYYDLSSAVLNWSAADPISGGVASGVEAYSYLLDRHSGTAPDSIPEGRAWFRLTGIGKGSYNQTIKSNRTGAAYSVFSQLRTNLTVNDSVVVRLVLAEQFSDFSDLMGVKVYLAKAGEGVSVSAFDMESSAVSNVANVSQDIRYAESMSLGTTYAFELSVNESFDDSAQDLYVVVSGLPSDDDNVNPIAIAGTTDVSLVDSSTKNFVCDESNVCAQNTTTIDYAIDVRKQDSGSSWGVRYDLLGDGAYYFHVKAKDRAGNWGDTSHFRLNIAAGGVSSVIYSPVDGEVFATNSSSTNTTVRVAVSGNASVRVVALHPDGSNYTSPAYVFDSSLDFESVLLELGENQMYAVTNTSYGAIAHSAIVRVTVASSAFPLTNRTLKVSYTGGCVAVSTNLCYSSEGTRYFGMGKEGLDAIVPPDVQADTSRDSIKIYATKQFDTAAISSELSQNIFLDRINPLFGYKLGENAYTIRNELRYNDIWIGGDFRITPGTYRLHMIKRGISPDGTYNITLGIQ
jgi:hypothetical protein